MDPVAVNIMDSTIVSICREMGIVLMKTAYSTIFSEALDFTCGLANMDGDLMAVADYCPSQIGGLPHLVKSCLREIPASEIEEGDVILHNDPYRGGLHTPEHTFFKPIFVESELMGFAVAIGHIQEVGGMVPGGFCGEATEIFHEGIRVPPIKIKKRGQDSVEVWKLLLANVRTPRANYGDLCALIAAVDLGESRTVQVIEKYGKALFRETIRDLLDYSERRMRAELEAIPDGIYPFKDYIESDGVEEERTYVIEVEVHKFGSEIVIVYPGKGPDQRDARGGDLSRLQCGLAHDGSIDPAQLRLLSPDSGTGATWNDSQRGLSRSGSWRKYRDPSANRRDDSGRDGQCSTKSHDGC
jgi:N-methylhydantoinase B